MSIALSVSSIWQRLAEMVGADYDATELYHDALRFAHSSTAFFEWKGLDEYRQGIYPFCRGDLDESCDAMKVS